MDWKCVSKSALKWSAITAGALILLMVFLFGLLQTETGRKSLVRVAARAFADGERKVEMGSIRGVVPFHFRLDSMSVADDRGVLFKLGSLEIDWSPLSLLRGDIHVRTLKCAYFHLDRVPKGGERKDGSFRLPRWLSLFKRLRIDHLAAAEFVSGESILGERAAFKLEADLKAALPGGEWVTRLALERTDGPEARLLVHGSVRENGRLLLLHVDAREAKGGLLSGRAAIEGPISLTLQGEGPPSSWKGRMEVKAGGAGSLDARIQAAYANGVKLEMHGYAEPETGFLPDFLESAAGGRIRVSLKGDLGDDRRLHIEQLFLESERAGLAVSGSSDLRDGSLNAHFQSRYSHLPMGGSVVSDGSISGTIFRPTVDLKFESGDLRVKRIGVSELIGEIHMDMADVGKGTVPGLHFNGKGRVKGLSIKDMDPLPERDLQWSFSGERLPSKRVIVRGMTLKGEKNSVELSGEFHPSTWDGKLEAEAETKDLRGFSEKLLADFTGSARLKAAMEGNLKTLSGSGTLQGDVKPEMRNRRAGVGSQRLYPVLGERLDFKARFSLERGRKLTVSETLLSSTGISFSGRGTLDLDNLESKSKAHIQVHDLERWSSAAGMRLGGALQARASVDGSPEKLTMRAEIEGKEVLAGKVHLGTVRLFLDGSGKVRSNDGSFRLNAGEQGERISGEGRFSTRGERISLTKLLLSGPGNSRAKGNLELDLDTRLAEGSLSGECPDLAPFSKFVNHTLEGKVEFSAEMGKSRKMQQVKMTFSATNLKADPFEAGAVRLQATMAQLSDKPLGNAHAEFRDARMPGVHVSTLALKAKGDGSEVSFDADARGALDRKFDLETQGLYRALADGYRLKITRFRGSYGELPFRIPEPFAMERSGGEFSTASVQLVLGGGRLSGGGKMGTGEVDLSIRFEDLPMNLVRPAAFPSMEGRGSGELALKGKLERPEGMARIRISGLRGQNPQLKEIPPAVLVAQADLRDQRLKGELTLHGITSMPFETKMDIPFNLILDPFRVSFPSGQSVQGDLNGKADLARLGGFLGLYDQTMSGIAEIAFSLEGTSDHPAITGRIGVEKGSYENARSGTILKDVNVLLTAGTKGLVIERASASDGETGTAQAEGWLEIDPQRGFPFQVDLTFQKSKMVRHDWVTARGKGSVQLKGSFSRAILSGEVEIENGEFRIPERLPPDIAELEVIEINGPGGVKQVRPEKEKQNPYLDFDLRLKSPGRFFVRGRGLESEWAGELRLTGSTIQPKLTGELSLERGRFVFLDRRFTLTEGKITFNGMDHPSPFLDVLATSSAKEITAQLRLVGPARTPEIKLGSEPPLPQDEVLARLLFGRSMNRISPLQAIQLAQTLNMMGGRKSLDLMGATRKLLRVDQLEVKKSGENDSETSLAAGKYLRDNVYIEVERSLGPGGTKASVEWEFTPHTSVETEIGEHAESGIGINWKWDY